MTLPYGAEHEILVARARGGEAADVSFERLYALYRRLVWSWLAVRVDASEVDDLAQDVWTIFYRRWQEWRFADELEPDAKPVLSFLYRTCHLTLAGFRRARHRTRTDELERGEDVAAVETWQRQLELKECLSTAQAVCSADELDILMGKLAGVPARAIARALGVTESAVDHGYRRAIAKVRGALTGTATGERRPHV